MQFIRPLELHTHDEHVTGHMEEQGVNMQAHQRSEGGICKCVSQLKGQEVYWLEAHVDISIKVVASEKDLCIVIASRGLQANQR